MVFFSVSSSCFRSLNELRVLLLDSPRHSLGLDRDLSREVHKAEWRVKEQKLQDDIKTLRDKLLLLVRGRGFWEMSSTLLAPPVLKHIMCPSTQGYSFATK